jgi:hypothetical protein
MKKLLRLGILCGVLAALLCVGAFAAAPPKGTATEGIYDVSSTEILTPTKDGGTDAVSVDGEIAGFYSTANSLKVTKTGLTAGGEYLLLVLNSKELPTEQNKNIWFIDQAKADSDGKVTFNKVYPKQMASGTTYNVYVIGDKSTFTATSPDATFAYYAPYKLGDVNNVGGITPLDASLILKYYVGLETDAMFAANNFSVEAADVNQEGGVTPLDASLVLKRYVGLVGEDFK